MLVRAPYILPFVFMVCWCRYNTATPISTQTPVASRMQNGCKKEKINSLDNRNNNIAMQFRTRRNVEPMGVAFDNKYNAQTSANLNDYKLRKTRNTARNRNVNKNVNINIIGRNRGKKHRQRENHVSVTTEYNWELIAKEDKSVNCASGKKENQRYSSSFVGNTTSLGLNVDKEFNEVIGNNSKEKKISSVHVGEDITLCWIETTIIKEDKTIRPPRRLVIREYTISFENSATIPDRYLECKRVEGELATNDPDIGKTALFEVIDENTKVSKVVNFTTVSHIGNILVWQHKRVKCGVGPVISKNIIEWPGDTKNPKKRVEIKVSPKMHRLTATKTEETPCSEEIEVNTESNGRNNFTVSCKNGEGDCAVTTESGESLTKNPESGTTEEIITEIPRSGTSVESNSKEDLTLPIGITEQSTSSNEEIFTTVSDKKDELLIPRNNTENCEENSSDPACVMKRETSSSVELSTELLTTTEAIAKSEASQIFINTKMTSKIPSITDSVETTKEVSSEEDLSTTTETSIDLIEKNIASTISALATEEVTPFAHKTDVSIESSETPHGMTKETNIIPENISTYHAPGTKIITSTSMIDIEKKDESFETTTIVSVEDLGTTPEGRDSSATEESIEHHSTMIPVDLTSKKSIKVFSTTVSGETDSEEVTIVVPSSESTEESERPDSILVKSSEIASPSTESVTIEPSSEEVSHGKSEETTGGTTIGLEATSNKGTPVIPPMSSLPKIKPIDSSTTKSSEVEYVCENSENCVYVSSKEICDEFGNCSKTTTQSCESGECSDKEVVDHSEATLSTLTEIQSSVIKLQSSDMLTTAEIQHTTAASITTTTLISREAENSSTVINNVPTTVETRRSTPLVTTVPQHKLTLKIKVLLEHVNEKKEKQKLVEVEKHLPLNESPEHYEHDLIERVKSLNNSINMEAISALLNCTSLSKLAKDPNFISKQSNDTVDDYLERLDFEHSDESITQQSNSEQFHTKYEDSQYPDSNQERESVPRRRRSLDVNDTEINETIGQNVSNSNNNSLIMDSDNSSAILEYENVTYSIQLSTTTNNPEEEINDDVVYLENGKNMTERQNESKVLSVMKDNGNETKMELVRQTLPGIQEDISLGLQHVVSQLEQGNLTFIDDTKKKIKKGLLDILADPKDSRIYLRRRREAAEEVGRWSNERIKEVPIGGSLRSFTEFTLYKVLP